MTLGEIANAHNPSRPPLTLRGGECGLVFYVGTVNSCLECG